MNHCQSPYHIDLAGSLKALLAPEFKPVCFTAGLALLALGLWLLAEALVVKDLPLLANALLGCLLPGLGLLYRGLFPMDNALTLGYLLIWMFLAGIARSLEEPDTLLTAHMLVGCILFLLPGLVLLRITTWETGEGTYPGEDARRWDSVSDDPPDPPGNADPQQPRREPPGHASESPRRTYLRVLGLEGAPSPARIRAAYRREIRLYHPDRVAHLGPELLALAERKAAEINLAYDYLLRQRR